MAMLGIECLTYGVEDVEKSCRFFEDFGLRRAACAAGVGSFNLPEGSHVLIHHRDDPALPQSSLVGDGVREVIWGVDTEAALEALAAGLSTDRDVKREGDGTVRFLTDFGLAMGMRLRAYPKAIAHVVFAVPDHQAGYAFMRDRLGFRLSDNQCGFGMYLRADGTNNHHNLLLLNAAAPFPGMDGMHRFHHANFAVEDIDEIMVGANHMVRCSWEPSHLGLGPHRIDSAPFYSIPSPAGGEAQSAADP